MITPSQLDFATHPLPTDFSPVGNGNESREKEEYINHLAAIVESSEDAIVSKSLDGIIKTWNKGSEKMFGFTAKEAVGQNISIIIPTNYIEEEQRIFKKICNKEFTGPYETVRRKKNGKHFHVSLTISLLKDRQGNIIGISKIARDITSRKKSEAELLHTNKELENRTEALKQSNDKLAFQNEEKEKRAAELSVANRELIFQNTEKEKRAAELIIANNELAFQNLEKEKRAAELIVANKELTFQNTEKEKRAAELIIANKELAFQNLEKEKRAAELIVANKELTFQNTEKEKRAAELIIANKELTFQNAEKEKRARELIIARELVFQNAEKAKSAEELKIANEDLIVKEKQLKEANKELEAFSYSISHDLRAPLRAISGYSIILQEDYQPGLDAEATRIINVIIDNTRMMSELIDDLLSFSKMARLEVADDSIDMKKIAEKCVDELTQIDKQKKNYITIHPMNECKGDASMLKQVWHNLLNNALKYSSKKPNPEIEAGMIADEKRNIYYLKDNGTGFDMKYAGKLFGVFQRLHRQDEFEGTGVGLALAKRIINKHGGEIWAEAILNEGAVFYFSIPKTI